MSSAPSIVNIPKSSESIFARIKSLIPVLKETVGDWMQDNAIRLSAALSLYTILSLAPLLVVTIKIVSVVWRGKDAARDQMMAQMVNLMGSDAAGAIKPMLDNGGKAGNGVLATVISSAVLLFSATGVFIELQDSMNTIWGVKPIPNQGLRNFIRNRLLSLSMVFGIAFLLLVSMFVSTVLASLAKYIVGDAGWMAIGLDIIVSFLVVAVLFAAIFKFLPDVKLAWRHVWLGAIMTAGLFTIGKYGLALYFKYGTPTSAFGAAGSLAAVLLWVYYSAFILFFGAEFTKVWSARNHGHRVVPEPNAVKVTEEDRAKRGIPSEKRMDNALAGRPLSAKPPPAGTDQISPPVAKASIFVMSAIAASMGACYLLGKSHAEHNHQPPL